MLKAGTSLIEISPMKGAEMAGYPHCPRPNIGVHDPLYAAALFLDDGEKKLVWVTLDILYFGKQYTRAVREMFPGYHIMLTCSHTHSAPWGSTPEATEQEEGAIVRPEYMEFLLGQLKTVITEAITNTFDAKLGTYIGKCGAEQGVGGNRRNPKDLADPTVNVLSVKDMDDKVRTILFSYALHPTYLHAENLYVTADYPGYTRRYLSYAAPDAVFMFAQGTSGNQSSRYFRTGQTFDEACRVGTTLGVEVYHCLEKTEYSSDVKLKWASREVEMPMRVYPPLDVAEKEQTEARKYFHDLEASDADYITKRNAELSMFGAENRYCYAKYLQKHGQICQDDFPNEVSVVEIGDTVIFSMQGEIFVEYGVELKNSTPKKAFVFEVTNGTLPGYIYTPESVAEGGYEVGTSVFDETAGALVVKTLKELLNELK